MKETDDALGCLIWVLVIGLLVLIYYHGPKIADMILGNR